MIIPRNSNDPVVITIVLKAGHRCRHYGLQRWRKIASSRSKFPGGSSGHLGTEFGKSRQ
jgi:hypothetical protein